MMLQDQARQETVYYQDAAPVYISNLRAIFYDRTFPINAITHVNVQTLKPRTGGSWALILLGIGIICIAGIVSDPHMSTGNNGIFTAVYGTIGVLVVIYGLVTMLRTKPNYGLIIGVQGVPVLPIQAASPEYINNLQNILNWLLVSRVQGSNL